MGTGRVVRAGRAAVFAAACVLLAATGHVLASGTPVPGPALAAALGGAGALGWLTARRERGPLAVTALTVGVQAALHAVFSLGRAASVPSAPASSTPAPSMSVPSASGGLAVRWARLLLCGAGPPTGDPAPHPAEAAAMPGMPGMAGMPGVPGMVHHAVMVTDRQHTAGGMLLAHLLAALLLGLWLAAGERAVHGLARTAAARLFAPVLLLLGAVPPTAPPRLRRPRGAARRPRPRVLVHPLVTRGPPPVPAVA